MKLVSKKWLKKRNRSFLPHQHRPSLTRSAPSWVDVPDFDTRVPYYLWSGVVAAMRQLMRGSQREHFDPAPEGPYTTTDSVPSGVEK